MKTLTPRKGFFISFQKLHLRNILLFEVKSGTFYVFIYIYIYILIPLPKILLSTIAKMVLGNFSCRQGAGNPANK